MSISAPSSGTSPHNVAAYSTQPFVWDEGLGATDWEAWLQPTRLGVPTRTDNQDNKRPVPTNETPDLFKWVPASGRTTSSTDPLLDFMEAGPSADIDRTTQSEELTSLRQLMRTGLADTASVARRAIESIRAAGNRALPHTGYYSAVSLQSVGAAPPAPPHAVEREVHVDPEAVALERAQAAVDAEAAAIRTKVLTRLKGKIAHPPQASTGSKGQSRTANAAGATVDEHRKPANRSNVDASALANADQAPDSGRDLKHRLLVTGARRQPRLAPALQQLQQQLLEKYATHDASVEPIPQPGQRSADSDANHGWDDVYVDDLAPQEASASTSPVQLEELEEGGRGAASARHHESDALDEPSDYEARLYPSLRASPGPAAQPRHLGTAGLGSAAQLVAEAQASRIAAAVAAERARQPLSAVHSTAPGARKKERTKGHRMKKPLAIKGKQVVAPPSLPTPSLRQPKSTASKSQPVVNAAESDALQSPPRGRAAAPPYVEGVNVPKPARRVSPSPIITMESPARAGAGSTASSRSGLLTANAPIVRRAAAGGAAAVLLEDRDPEPPLEQATAWVPLTAPAAIIGRDIRSSMPALTESSDSGLLASHQVGGPDDLAAPSAFSIARRASPLDTSVIPAPPTGKYPRKRTSSSREHRAQPVGATITAVSNRPSFVPSPTDTFQDLIDEVMQRPSTIDPQQRSHTQTREYT
jgi:hypothetical protein